MNRIIKELAQRIVPAAVAAICVATAIPASAGTVYFLDLVNNAASSVVAFDVARPGSERYHSVLYPEQTLPGGGKPASVAIRLGEDGCLRDLRIRFADNHVVTHRGFDICGNLNERRASVGEPRVVLILDGAGGNGG
jgi:hypothetical protein